MWYNVGRVASSIPHARIEGGPVVQHQSYANYFVMTCDRCGRLETVSTAKTAAQARQVATMSFSWETDTPLGDLCHRCARDWHLGYLDVRPR